MNTLIIKNASAEGPGTIGDFLLANRISHSILDLEHGEKLPDLRPYTHVVIMGGPMAVYEMDQVPYLRQEAALIEQAITSGKHVLGVCLGSQLLAHVLGAKVYPGGLKEIGWDEVSFTDEGMADPLMSRLAVEGRTTAQVFQWHGDTFDLPKGAVLLASSGLYRHQAFRFSDRVYALQFHIEVTPGIVFGWLKHETTVDLKAIDERSKEISVPYLTRARAFYQGFFTTIPG